MQAADDRRSQRSMGMRRFVSLFLVVMFALRSLLPVGFMLEAHAGENGAKGSIEIVICTAHGSKLVTLDHDGKPTERTGQKANHASCPYSMAGVGVTPDVAPTPLALAARYAAADYKIAKDVFRATPKPEAVSARGPPLFVS